MVTVLLVIPRLVITVLLLWLGCRWLLATLHFADILLNGVALEFILCTKDLLYMTIMPQRNMKDVQNTKFGFGEDVPAAYIPFIGTFVWLGLAVVWVYVYTYYLQQVLPEYRWDIHDVCSDFLHDLYS